MENCEVGRAKTIFTYFKLLYQHIMIFSTDEDSHENIDNENWNPNRDSITGPRQFKVAVALHTTFHVIIVS